MMLSTARKEDESGSDDSGGGWTKERTLDKKAVLELEDVPLHYNGVLGACWPASAVSNIITLTFAESLCTSGGNSHQIGMCYFM